MAAKKKAPKNPLSETDVLAFDAFVKHWQNILHLGDWRFERSDKPTKYMACIQSIEPEHRLVRYSVGSDFGLEKVTPRSIESCALHEVLHVLLNPIIDDVIAQGEYNDIVMASEHAVIVLLEDLLLNAYGASKDA